MSGRTTQLVPEVERRDSEALAIYVVLGLVGALRVIVALALGESFGAEDTIAAAMVLGALVGLVTRR